MYLNGVQTREEALVALREVRDRLSHCVELIDAGVRPCNKEWTSVAEPMNKVINYVGNRESDLVDADDLRRYADGADAVKTDRWDSILRKHVCVCASTGEIEVDSADIETSNTVSVITGNFKNLSK